VKGREWRFQTRPRVKFVNLYNDAFELTHRVYGHINSWSNLGHDTTIYIIFKPAGLTVKKRRVTFESRRNSLS